MPGQAIQLICYLGLWHRYYEGDRLIGEAALEYCGTIYAGAKISRHEG